MENLVLIGMPSSGKSTIGAPLAKELGMDFIDTDLLIKHQEKRQLKDIVKQDGLDKFLQIQENVILNINASGCVISTGGSVIYREDSMNHLKNNGMIIFLDIIFDKISSRVSSGRRFAKNENQSLYDIYLERMPLYKKYADLTINCTNKNIEEVVLEIKKYVL